MKTNLEKLIAGAVLIALIGCDYERWDRYERLKAETGFSDEELERGILLYTDFVVEMKDEIDAGEIDVQTMVENVKIVKELQATVIREEEMSAVVTLSYLKALERSGADRATELMVAHLERFRSIDSERSRRDSVRIGSDPIRTELSVKLRQRIDEFAQTSQAFERYGGQSEQSGARQPATRSESEHQ